jgi:glycosyltransferase involved in cell wall biosynthesis
MLLSIIIPAYNVEKYIGSVLDMLISQGLSDSEVIIIDDGSNDNTFQVAKNAAAGHLEIRIIHQKNQGVSVARNEGMKLSRGKYIYFLDADDTLSEGTLDYYRTTLITYPENNLFAFGYEVKVGGKIKKQYISTGYDQQILARITLQKGFLYKKLYCHICSCIYGSKFLQNNNLFFTPCIKIGEDIEFILKVINKVNQAYYDKRICFIYQIRNDSAMQGYRNYSQTQFNSFVIIYNMVNNIRSKELDLACNYFIVNSYISNIRHYLLSSCIDQNITNGFIRYNEILSYKLPFSVLDVIKLVLKTTLPVLLYVKSRHR